MSNDAGDTDVTRRTHLASERTWLAWWRTGIAASTAAVAVGGVVPNLVDRDSTPYVILGVAYASAAVAIFLIAARRQRRVDAALHDGRFERLDPRALAALTAAGVALAVGTLAVIIVAA